ncbi:MAG: glyoxalase [Actinomycetota bacterium]|nr:glyoxalase [Actinomycetota bacterium]
MGAPVVWFEVAGRDFDQLSKFYSELFHWKVNADNPTGYGMVDTDGGGGIQGGIFAAGDTEYVSFYVQVPDLEARLKRAENLGAKVLQPPTPTAPEGPTIAMISDPEGHRIGVLQEPS